MCCYNASKYLNEAIQSILSQTFKDWELIIINDGSTDNTEDIVKKYINNGVKDIKYDYQKHSGLASARNKAIKLSQGEWIAILDQDDIWYPDKLEKQLHSISKYPKAQLHFSNSEWFYDNGTILRRTIEDKKFTDGLIQDAFYRLLLEDCFIDTETVLIKKKILIDCGGFEEKYHYIADYDMFLKIANKYPICYQDEILARWRLHPAQITQRLKDLRYMEYIDLFENILKKHLLPQDIKNGVENVITSNAFKYSLFQMRKGEFKTILPCFRKIRFFPLIKYLMGKIMEYIRHN